MITKHPHHSRVTVSGHVPVVDPAVIDSLYGLEPVYDPATRSGAPLGAFVSVLCPHCWQSQTIEIDLSAATPAYIEDCRVCCQPMQIGVVLDAHGEIDKVEAERLE